MPSLLEVSKLYVERQFQKAEILELDCVAYRWVLSLIFYVDGEATAK
jgi:hypothetical protein